MNPLLLKKIRSNPLLYQILRDESYHYQYLLENLRKQDSSVPHLYNILMSYQNMRSNKQSAEVEYNSTVTVKATLIVSADVSEEDVYNITKAIFELSQILGSGPVTACAFGVWTMLFMTITLVAGGLLLGKKLSSVFKL